MMRTCLLVTLLLCPGAASAQTGDDDVRRLVRRGQQLVITDVHGRVTAGRVTTMTDTSITVERRRNSVEFPFSEIAAIDRPKDGVGDGALKGLAMGAAMGAIAGLSGPSPSQSDFCGMGFFDDCGGGNAATSIIVGGGIGALVGASLDALIRRDRHVYRRRATSVVASPTFGPRGAGGRVMVSW